MHWEGLGAKKQEPFDILKEKSSGAFIVNIKDPEHWERRFFIGKRDFDLLVKKERNQGRYETYESILFYNRLFLGQVLQMKLKWNRLERDISIHRKFNSYQKQTLKEKYGQNERDNEYCDIETVRDHFGQQMPYLAVVVDLLIDFEETNLHL